MSGRCAACRWFEGRVAGLEAAIGGLAVLASAAASVRGDDGLCRRHDVIVGRGGQCAGFADLADGKGPGRAA